MGNCASWCGDDEDENLAASVRRANHQQMSPSYGYKQPPMGRSGGVATNPPAEISEEEKRKIREAAEKRYTQGKSTQEAGGALRYQQERRQKIEEAEDRVARAGGIRETPLRWQQD